MGEPFKSSRPFQFLYIDFLGPYPRTKTGNIAILTVLDSFSKFVFLEPLKAETAADVTRFLEDVIFCTYGVPEVIFTDNGKQFISKTFQDFLSDYGVKHVKTAVYSPHPNAAERVNRSVLAALRAYIQGDHTTWDVHLPKIACALRTSVHQSIGVNPYYVLFGQHMARHGSTYPLLKKLKLNAGHDVEIVPAADKLEIICKRVLDELSQAHIRHSKAYNTRSRAVRYLPGQEVFRRVFTLSNMAQGINAKFDNRFAKARIVKAIGNSRYELEDMKGRRIGIYHAKDISIIF